MSNPRLNMLYSEKLRTTNLILNSQDLNPTISTFKTKKTKLYNNIIIPLNGKKLIT